MTSHPLIQLVLARTREFYRQPEAVFWVYVFPLLLAGGLGLAFRTRPIERIVVDIQQGKGAERIARSLKEDERFIVQIHDDADCQRRLRTGKTTLVVVAANGETPLEYFFDPTRAESLVARRSVNDAIQRAAGRMDPVAVADRELNAPGSRYIDFLIPGLLGMNLMGGGLWGIGFVAVDMRLRKLLKRFLATPMKKPHFLLGMILSRMLFMIPEVIFILLFARWVFGVVIYGSLTAVVVLVFLGATTFTGVGLLVASRAKTLEGVSGLMNLVMLPMWLLSGIFFSAERFPETVQPFLHALPLTPLINSLRAVMLEGASLASQGWDLSILGAYTVVTFTLALWWFRWE